jgi:biotin transport system substrate-specific component
MKLTAKDLIVTATFTSLMVAGTFIRIPFPFLPVTLQTFICGLAGIIIGPRLGALSMLIYTALGLAGIPVFAGGGGITYIFNSSFGFILGFIGGSYATGLLLQKTGGHTVAGCITALMAGLLVIYSAGICYMLVIMRFYLGDNRVGLPFLLTINLPYIIKDFILFSAAAFITPSIKARLAAAGKT